MDDNLFIYSVETVSLNKTVMIACSTTNYMMEYIIDNYILPHSHLQANLEKVAEIVQVFNISMKMITISRWPYAPIQASLKGQEILKILPYLRNCKQNRTVKLKNVILESQRTTKM